MLGSKTLTGAAHSNVPDKEEGAPPVGVKELPASSWYGVPCATLDNLPMAATKVVAITKIILFRIILSNAASPKTRLRQ